MKLTSSIIWTADNVSTYSTMGQACSGHETLFSSEGSYSEWLRPSAQGAPVWLSQ